MQKGLEYALKRPLTETEERYIEWLQRWDKETITVFDLLFKDMYRAGQIDCLSTQTK
ncbi:hypothetical protein RB620_04525 [Paenibacillus sp. LHD-117]|uniref:hypothetical protein n=1 Tax=Paenibacillus sp. LHD-117 TaxID=3071412 RepID=UPI0027E13CE6|nr:hypothetical protein [Paenibacillus sp. LHD-117]MDQ6418698.1 hypothetical protein [Paenibacillus sp. LHD-117]